MLKILTVFGTRPEVIKMAPVINEFKKYRGKIICRTCVTGQHRQMIDPLLELFGLKADYDLNIMRENQTLRHITTSVLDKMERIIKKERPDYLMVQGDTTTGMAAALAAYYQKVKITHVEAGLRTQDKYHPYPEEANRRIIDAIGDLYFAHTQWAKENLINEGVAEEKIEVTGNTVIDALLDISKRKIYFKGTELENVPMDKKIILVTAHRRESFGTPLMNICKAIKEVASKYGSEVVFVYPVHLNPNVQGAVYSLLKNIHNVFLIEPLRYEYLVHLMKKSYLILTDSGGIQEEAPSLRKPVLVLREVTERPEAVKAGVVEVVGTNKNKIIEMTIELLEDKAKYKKMARGANPYGDGKASRRIVRRFLLEAGKNG